MFKFTTIRQDDITETEQEIEEKKKELNENKAESIREKIDNSQKEDGGNEVVENPEYNNFKSIGEELISALESNEDESVISELQEKFSEVEVKFYEAAANLVKKDSVQQTEIVYEESVARDFVDAINQRLIDNFDHILGDNEYVAMVDLFTELGIDIDDLFMYDEDLGDYVVNQYEVERFADNYYINAKKIIFTPEEIENGVDSWGKTLEDAENDSLFSWIDESDGSTHFVTRW